MKELIQQFEKIAESKSVTSLNVSKVIVTRLCLERLGEIDHNSLWQSRTLSSFGNTKLKEMVPKTHTLATIRIAFEIVHKKEQELIKDKEYISLFRLTPETEKLIDSIIHTSLERLANIIDSIPSSFKFEEITLTKAETDKISTQRELVSSTMGSFSLGELDESSLSQEKLNQVIDSLIYAWSKNKKGQLIIPYYRLRK